MINTNDHVKNSPSNDNGNCDALEELIQSVDEDFLVMTQKQSNA